MLGLCDHYNHHMWYEIKDPYGDYLKFSTTDIYEAIDKINQELEKGKNEGYDKFIDVL